MARVSPSYEARAKVSEILRLRSDNNTTGTSNTAVGDGALSENDTGVARLSSARTSLRTSAPLRTQRHLNTLGNGHPTLFRVPEKLTNPPRKIHMSNRNTGQMPTHSTMFGIGSVSKMFAAIAVMKLVDRGVVDLDTPLVTYLPAFRMAAAGYENITVRMLLNHSSGFPGTDYRNAVIRSPVPGYLDQVLQTLSMSRLKAPAGLHERLL